MKKKNKKNWKKIIIISMIIIIIFLLIVRAITRKNNKPVENNVVNTDFKSIEDIIVFYESKYYKEEKSKKEGYDLDIYVSFKYNLFEGEESKENFFKMVIETIVRFDDFESIRLIDESKGITIEVKCNKNSQSITAIYYNGDENYFKNEISKKSFDNTLKIETIYPNINSEILNDCINQNWISRDINFGTQESTFNKYSIYFDEGYSVRTIQRKVYNLVFTEKYNNSIINGIKVGDDFSNIQRKLGDGFTDSTGTLLGYKTQNFYIIFSENEVSIYPIIKYSTDEFENLVDEYNNSNDIIDFMDKLTDLWPDYDYYSYDTGYLDISYTLKGIRISYNVSDMNGIKIYENYIGNYSNEKTDNKNVIYQLDKSLIMESEQSRLVYCEIWNPESNIEEMKYSERFVVQLTEEIRNGNYKNVKIKSLDTNYPDNEFDENTEVSDYIWIDDFNLVYTTTGKGIYLYNAETRQIIIIDEGVSEFEIKGFDTESNILSYDDKKVIIK